MLSTRTLTPRAISLRNLPEHSKTFCRMIALHQSIAVPKSVGSVAAALPRRAGLRSTRLPQACNGHAASSPCSRVASERTVVGKSHRSKPTRRALVCAASSAMQTATPGKTVLGFVGEDTSHPFGDRSCRGSTRWEVCTPCNSTGMHGASPDGRLHYCICLHADG